MVQLAEPPHRSCRGAHRDLRTASKGGGFGSPVTLRLKKGWATCSLSPPLRRMASSPGGAAFLLPAGQHSPPESPGAQRSRNQRASEVPAFQCKPFWSPCLSHIKDVQLAPRRCCGASHMQPCLLSRTSQLGSGLESRLRICSPGTSQRPKEKFKPAFGTAASKDKT